MFTIKSPLQYFPMTVGDYSLNFDKHKNIFGLHDKKQSWMGYDLNTHWQSTEFYIEIEKANGICITTGLGLGILQSHLCLKQNVTKVIVYEKSPDVIEMFHRIVEFNKFDISKIEIRNEDANNIVNQSCDCLFPDHFELENEEYIIGVVKKLSENNQAGLVWYWPAGNHFIKFAMRKNLSMTHDTYELWKNYTGIKHLPNNFDDNTILYLQELKNVYQRDAAESSSIRYQLDMIEQRNNLLKLKSKL
jgi:hypothetical protein